MRWNQGGIVVALVALLAALPARAVETHCANAQDDDRDGVIDCADSDCVGDSGCDAHDFDGDGSRNGDDCAPLDATRFAPSAEVPLLLAFDAPEPDVRVLWSDMGVGSAYDVVGGSLGDLVADRGATRASVLVSGLPQSWWVDARPTSGDRSGFWLAVREHDACGAGPTGVESLDTSALLVEDCANGIDDDGDGLVDCVDDDCAGTCGEDCANGSDDDADGLTDCDDPGCFGAACPELCDDASDNDDDGLTDCADDDCDAQGPCIEDCANRIDDDGNGLTDCVDPACAADATCCERCSGWRSIPTPTLTCQSVSSGPCGSERLIVNVTAGARYLFSTCGECGGMATPGAVLRFERNDCFPWDQYAVCDRTGSDVPEFVVTPTTTGTWILEVESSAPWTVGYRQLWSESEQVTCHDGVDEDFDGLTDCDDPDCASLCDESIRCDDGDDDDQDGLTDCDDPDCASSVTCRENANCTDGADNDRDSLVDCADPDCASFCREDLNCSDLRDNDGDGLRDCADPDCSSNPTCREGGHCRDGIDNDADAFIDCDDPDCASDAGCAEPGDCRNGFDDDRDGLVDCADPGCIADPTCHEDCWNGVDDNDDGAIDCADLRCAAGPDCCDGCSSTSELIPAPTEACRQYREDGPCLHRWLAVDLEGGTAYEFSTCASTCSGSASYDSSLILRLDCGTVVASNDDFCGVESKIRVLAPSTGRYQLEILGSFPHEFGRFTLGYRSLGHEDTDAECTDGFDDDADTLADCADPDCAGHGAC